jgi:hypothetical protein
MRLTASPPHRLTASPHTPRNRKGQHQKQHEQQQRQPEQDLRNRRRGRGDPGKAENSCYDGDGEENDSPFQHDLFRVVDAEGEMREGGVGFRRSYWFAEK